jgi:hypothetical protein
MTGLVQQTVQIVVRFGSHNLTLFVRCILTELMNNFARTLVLVRHHKPLRGGTSAPQNLQGTVWLLLLAGTT